MIDINLKLIMGLGCNMKCPYCYQIKEHDFNKVMEKNVIDEIVKKLNSHSDTYHNICLFGGEPLLYKDNILYLMSKLDKNKCDIAITTNAYDREAFNEIQSYWGKPIHCLLSNKEHKDYRRLNDYCGFRWVATTDNINELTDELVDFLSKEYKEHIQFKYSMSDKWEKEHLVKLEHIKSRFRKNLGSDFEMELPINYNSKKTCGAKELTINYNGNFLPCHRNLRMKTIKNIFNSNLEEFVIPNCIAVNTSNVENMYKFSGYEFKGFNTFGDR